MGGRTRNSTPKPSSAREDDARKAPDVRIAQKSPAEATVVARLLSEQWPDAIVELDFRNPYQLLVATILAAQSTDKMINTVTPALFAKFPDPAALAHADLGELEEMVHSTGFFRMKAKHLLEMARAVVAEHGGKVPDTMEALLELPGVARKTANVVLGNAFGKNEGFVVDTHIARVSGRLGLTQHTDPGKIEQDLMGLFPRDQWAIVANRLIWHGRRTCIARKPDCDHCALAPVCPSFGLFQLDPPRVATAKDIAEGKPGKPAAAKSAKPAAAKPAKSKPR